MTGPSSPSRRASELIDIGLATSYKPAAVKKMRAPGPARPTPAVRSGMTMSSYRVEYLTSLLLTVWVKADSEEDARSDAWDMANDYVTTVVGDGANVRADARVEAIGATSVIKQRGNE